MLVGRSRELAALARLGPDMPTALVGEAGVGKTTLLRAVASASGRTVFHGGGLASLSWMPYVPVARAYLADPPRGDHAAVADWAAKRTNGGLLVLDDLHWADADTLRLIPLLAGRIAFLTAVRGGDPGTQPALDRLEDVGARVVPVEGLRDADAIELVRRRNPLLHEQDVREIVDRAGGNPLMLEELAAGDVPSTSLRLAVGARLQRCSRGAVEALGLLGLLGRPAPRGLLPEPAVAELVQIGLVVDDGQVAPRHTLLAETAVERLRPGQRRRLHARLARLLPDPGEAARHHQAAGEHGPARTKALAAAEEAATPGERARHLGIAAECTSGRGADELRLQAASALVDTGDLHSVERLLAGVESPSGALLAETALCRARARFAQCDLEGAQSEIRAGIALVGPDETRVAARLQIEHARMALWAFDVPQALRRSRRAVRVARAAGAEEGQALAVRGAAQYIADSPASIDSLRDALRLARRQGDRACECEAALQLSMALVNHQRSDEARELARRMAAHARELGLLTYELYFRSTLGLIDVAHGRYEDGIAQLEHVADEPAHGPGADQSRAFLAIALADRGRDAEARALLDRAMVKSSSGWGRSVLLFARGECELLAGRTANARRAVDEYFSLEGRVQALAGEVACAGAWAAIEEGRAPLPRPLPAPSRTSGYAHHELRALDRLAAARDLHEAEQIFERAARKAAPTFLRIELRCLYGAGEAARRLGAAERARRRLLEVEHRARRHGLVPLLGRVERSLRQLGVHRAASRAPRDRGLSGREREVLALVAEGLRSPEIGRRLGVSRTTVEAQIASAMTKLGAKTRIQAAALAARDVEPT